MGEVKGFCLERLLLRLKIYRNSNKKLEPVFIMGYLYWSEGDDGSKVV